MCFSDNDRDKCFQFTMTKSVKNLIDNIGKVCQELKKSKRKSELECRRLQLCLSRAKCRQEVSNSIIPVAENAQQSIETPDNESRSETVDDSLKLKGGSTPGAFALNVAAELFTPDELRSGIISPKRSSSREILPADKVERVKKLVDWKFSGRWEEGRRAINQKGRDLKNKLENA